MTEVYAIIIFLFVLFLLLGSRFGLDWLSWGLLGLEWSCLHPVQLGMQ